MFEFGSVFLVWIFATIVFAMRRLLYKSRKANIYTDIAFFLCFFLPFATLYFLTIIKFYNIAVIAAVTFGAILGFFIVFYKEYSP